MLNDPTTNRKKIISLSCKAIIGLLTILTGLVSCGQAEKETFVVGYINPNPEEKEGAQGFLRNMPKFGYVEGENVTYIKCESKESERIDDAIKEMVAKKVDLIFAMTTPAAQKTIQYTKGTDIPVLLVLYDAVSSRVAESLIKPGGNVTGIQLRGSTSKALEWLLEFAPAAKHIFVPVCFDTGAAKQSLADLQQSASKAGLRLTVSEVKSIEELNDSLASMPQEINAIFLLHSWLVGSNVNLVLNKAMERKIPVASAGHVNFDDGLVMSYGPLDDRIGSQAAGLAHRILRGTPLADLPFETSGFYLGINLKTAKATGVEPADDILQQADFIIR